MKGSLPFVAHGSIGAYLKVMTGKPQESVVTRGTSSLPHPRDSHIYKGTCCVRLLTSSVSRYVFLCVMRPFISLPDGLFEYGSYGKVITGGREGALLPEHQ